MDAWQTIDRVYTLAAKLLRTVIIAKAPIPGFTKTRLIPALGEEGATCLAEKLLQNTVASVLEADLGKIELCVTPAPESSAWARHEFANVEWTSQVDGDLGARMAQCARNAVSCGESVLIIGTDCPVLDSSALQRAAGALTTCDSCLIPVLDGGYVLLGLNNFDTSLFSNIPWGTDQVSEITQERIKELGWSCALLPALYDIDEPDDLVRLPSEFLPMGGENT